MSQITTKSSKVERELTVKKPIVLMAENLDALVTILGADMCYAKVMAQLTVDFRSKMRSLMEANTEGELTNTDDAIIAMDFSDWKPEGRVRKSAEEKAAELFGTLTPDQIAAAMAMAGMTVPGK